MTLSPTAAGIGSDTCVKPRSWQRSSISADVVDIRPKQQTRESFERFEKKVIGLPEVVECCMIAGDWDYSLRVVSSDLASYQSFILDRLMHPDTDIASYRTTSILRKVKSTTRIDSSLFRRD